MGILRDNIAYGRPGGGKDGTPSVSDSLIDDPTAVIARLDESLPRFVPSRTFLSSRPPLLGKPEQATPLPDPRLSRIPSGSAIRNGRLERVDENRGKMDTAYSGFDDETWDAVVLNKKAALEPDSWLASRRPYFICRGCDAPAIFRRAFSDNRIANFAATHHDCDFSADPSGGLKSKGPADPVPAQYNTGGNKEVRYEVPRPLHGGVGGNAPSSAGPSKSKKKSGVVHALTPTKADNAHETTGLSRLLSNLRNGSDYPPPGVFFDVTTRGEVVRATDYLYKISDLTVATVPDGHTRAYWGKVSTTQESGEEDNKTLWIHCDNIGSVFSIRLDHEPRKQLYKALGISKGYELNKTHVIVEGVVKRGSKKLFIAVQDIKKMAFRPERSVPPPAS